MYFLGTLPPGASAKLEGFGQSVQLQTWLTGRHAVKLEDRTYRERSRRYPLESTDVAEILRAMMFYQAAGGRAYTQLSHRYQGYLDLSDHLLTGRAVMLGRGEAHASRLVRGGEELGGENDRSWTFYRVVFPVERMSE